MPTLRRAVKSSIITNMKSRAFQLAINQVLRRNETTVGPTVRPRPTVRSILKPCKCAITLIGRLPVITGKTAGNWRRAVLSADAGLLVFKSVSMAKLETRLEWHFFPDTVQLASSYL